MKLKINKKVCQIVAAIIVMVVATASVVLKNLDTKTNYKANLIKMQIAQNSKIEIINKIASSKIRKNPNEEQYSVKKVEIANLKADNKTTSRSSTKTRENVKNKKSETKKKEKYISIKDVRISKNMDLTKRTGLSREDFIKLISGVKQDTSGFFEKNAGKIYDLCKKYNINEIFFCGLISAESGWNIASNHRRTHNYISLMKGGKLIKYSSVDEGLEVAAQKLHNNYLTPGGKFYYGKTLSAVKTKFCPSSSTWVNLVYGRMQQIV